MLLPNDVVKYAAPDTRVLRILWIDAQQEVAYTFDLNHRTAVPRPARVLMLQADVQTRRAQLLADDPLPPRARDGVPAKHRALQARAWDMIAPLVAQLPDIFQSRERAQLVAARAAACGASRATLLRYLRRYWERGQTPDALLPDYMNSGAPGKTRAANAHVKRGRPRKAGCHPGLNADQQIRATFRAAVARYAATHDRFSRRGAYRQMLEDYFREREPDAVPTFGQFNYWIEKEPIGAAA